MTWICIMQYGMPRANCEWGGAFDPSFA